MGSGVASFTCCFWRAFWARFCGAVEVVAAIIPNSGMTANAAVSRVFIIGFMFDLQFNELIVVHNFVQRYVFSPKTAYPYVTTIFRLVSFYFIIRKDYFLGGTLVATLASLRAIEIVLTNCPDNPLGGIGIIWTTRIDYRNRLFQLSEQPKGDRVVHFITTTFLFPLPSRRMFTPFFG